MQKIFITNVRSYSTVSSIEKFLYGSHKTYDQFSSVSYEIKDALIDIVLISVSDYESSLGIEPISISYLLGLCEHTETLRRFLGEDFEIHTLSDSEGKQIFKKDKRHWIPNIFSGEHSFEVLPTAIEERIPWFRRCDGKGIYLAFTKER